MKFVTQSRRNAVVELLLSDNQRCTCAGQGWKISKYRKYQKYDIFDIFQKMKISNKLYNNGCKVLMQ